MGKRTNIWEKLGFTKDLRGEISTDISKLYQSETKYYKKEKINPDTLKTEIYFVGESENGNKEEKVLLND